MKATIFTIILCLVSLQLTAQTLKGKVINGKKHPLQEVNVLNKTTDKHTHSDEFGNFILENVSRGDTLYFSHIGYEGMSFVVENIDELVTIILKPKSIALEEVVLAPKVNTLNIITAIDIQTDPVNSSQDILKKVPGLFIGQHAGGGKAEQIFLRGFDIDHGTDINLIVDGLPVNMVSHAHGQGYSDLHFVIPETIENIDFGKGAYYEDKGNFTTAGYVNFETKESLDRSTIKLEGGQFDTFRLLGMFNVLDEAKHNAYVASEYIATDGPFESPQNFSRINIFGKYSGYVNPTDKVGVTFSHFTSKWDASGQIPQRAVDSGLITRFGAIDDTEGGNTSRSNVLINYDKMISDKESLKSSAFISKYDFELFSNFTFFLEDPVNGDQIKQKEDRTIFGFNSEYKKQFYGDKVDGYFTAGISLRNDRSVGNELSRTLNRKQTLQQIQSGDINETDIGAYVGTTLEVGKWMFNPSVRLDYFNFQYNDALLTQYQTQKETNAIVSPKLNVIYNSSDKLQLYLKTGKGFHSNDTRGVVAEEGIEILPASYGFDAGFVWKPTSKMLFNLAYWYLYLEQEFVYVGDAGIVEPSGETRRQGIDLSYRYQPMSWLYWNIDANYTHGRSINDPDGQNFIPLAPDFTLVSGLNVNLESGFYGGINVRYLDDRPANEDNSIVAEGYTVADLNMGYRWKDVSLGVQIQNLFDTDWNETQFATESRLQSETTPVEEIHFTPGTPFFFKASIQYNF
ncbi:TonB-dependent receptor [Tenacibaculum agarivorans]|uniref:TonB-dependent receptor n=1 Tax=Tenacibaculum agarivorans TaxID=1908389 RepID=UPI00094B88A8|nr:TonB-dependent receptor [Tenacibaculum agarivorans]